jgi:hypothetical protein
MPDGDTFSLADESQKSTAEFFNVDSADGSDACSVRLSAHA